MELARSGRTRVMHARTLWAAAAMAGCLSSCLPSCGKSRVSEKTMSLLMALSRRDAQATLSYFADEAAPPGLAEAASGPLVFRNVRVLDVVEQEGGWRVDYEAEISDYPSTIFNFLVTQQALEQSHLLRRYEEVVTLRGHLLWRRRLGSWRVAESPPEHEPVGRACALAKTMSEWKRDLPPEARGAAAFGRILSLLSATDEPNHAGPLTRSQVLERLAEKLTRAVAESGSLVLEERFLPARDESAPRTLEALAALDRVLSAWWRGEMESAVDWLTGVEDGSISPYELSESPVRLHSYEVLNVNGVASNTYAISVDLGVTDPASVFAVAICPQEIPDPRSYIELIDEGLKATQTFLVAKRGDRWMLASDDSDGAIGYFVRSGRLVSRLRFLSALPSDRDLLQADLVFRMTLAQLSFIGLRFSAVEREIEEEGQEKFVKDVMTRVLEASELSLLIGAMSPEERSFYLGSKISEYLLSFTLTDLVAASEVEKVERQISVLVESLDLGVDGNALRRTLLQTRLAGDSDEFIRLGVDIEGRILTRHGASLDYACRLGHAVGDLRTAVMFSDALGEESVLNPNIVEFLGVIDSLLAEMPGVRSGARESVSQLRARAQQGDYPSTGETEGLTEYSWFFVEPLEAAPLPPTR
jgi:hypothetical protein